MISATVKDTGSKFVHEVFVDGQRVRTRTSMHRYHWVWQASDGAWRFSGMTDKPNRNAVTIHMVGGGHQQGGYRPVACGRCGHVHTTLRCDRCGF